jgi:DNA-binding GntR family transcriptional regulator
MGEPLTFQRITTPAIRDSAYEVLRDKIMRKEFSPGQRLDLKAIETGLGISRTPLREALHRLASERLVEILPRSGTFVTVLSPREIAESFEVRRAIERYAVECAVQKATDQQLRECRVLLPELARLAVSADPAATYPQYMGVDYELHRRLVALADNHRLCRAYERENVHSQIARVHYRRTMRDLDITQHEHEAIMAALDRRDAAAAAAAMDRHLARAKAAILEDMRIAMGDADAATGRTSRSPSVGSRQ